MNGQTNEHHASGQSRLPVVYKINENTNYLRNNIKIQL